MNDSISIKVQDLSRNFGSIKAVDNVSLSFDHRHAMYGIIGPEGSGKTTLMRIMLGLLRPTTGGVQYFKNSNPVTYESVRPLIAYMPQQQSLYPDLSIEEHLVFFKDLYGIDGTEYEQKKEELLGITKLKDFLDRSAGKLSGGMYKKLGLMCALLRSPKVVLLDEPTNGVDPISRREFWDLLYRLSELKILIILTTAYMDEAERCAHVHLIEHGKIVSAGEPRALLLAEPVTSFDNLFLKRAGI